jgi:hypothetical protein
MAEDDGLDAPADTMRERVGANRLQMWVQVDGHRWAVTALVVAATFVLLLAFDAGGISGATLGVNDQYLFVSAAYAVAITPFAVLLAYVLRILTLIKRTLTLGPFILREESHGNGP